MDLNTLRSAATVVLLLLFIAIVAWAYGRSRRGGFEAAGYLPLLDEGPGPAPLENRRE